MSYSWRVMTALWWAGIIGLTLAGICVIILCGAHLVAKRRNPPAPPARPGRLHLMRNLLQYAQTGRYSRQQLHRIFAGLVVELLMSERRISEETAWQRVRQGDWQGGDRLNAYLEDPPDFERTGWRSLFRWMRPRKDPLFLPKTHELIDMLHEYSQSGAAGKISAAAPWNGEKNGNEHIADISA